MLQSEMHSMRMSEGIRYTDNHILCISTQGCVNDLS